MVDEDQNRLSDEELNALVSNHEEADFTAAVLDPSEIEQKSVRPHNLVTEDTTIGINLAAVDMITERFTRHLRLGLLEVLRTSKPFFSNRPRCSVGKRRCGLFKINPGRRGVKVASIWIG